MRALALLAAALPETRVDELAGLSIGQRDASLLQLRELLFGPVLTAVTSCPSCGEQVESTFRVAQVRVASDRPPDPSYAVDISGYRATFRLPNTCDLLKLADAETACDALFARCLTEVRDADGAAVNPKSLTPAVIAGIAARMADADPQAEIELALVCPACEHRWPMVFDIAGFLWKELNAWALQTLRDVHTLARSYGWREADVLALSPTRRQAYLELSKQ
ncbi:MAG: phage baseplate protein [Hyphomicrobiales bacterium]|nr:MAG: phage baseplate protein [Hyphomicrobiales bacterium]